MMCIIQIRLIPAHTGLTLLHGYCRLKLGPTYFFSTQQCPRVTEKLSVNRNIPFYLLRKLS
jgi:hypothetical protein